MPTKILVVETPTFQLGANAGESAERIAPEAFGERLARHEAATTEGSHDTLFVLAPADVRHQAAFAEAANGASSVSLCYFGAVNDAIRFLPSLLLFANDARALGVKCYLQKPSTIYNEALFNADAVGTRLDPCFVFARSRLPSPEAATSAWASIQALTFLGLQSLPGGGEKSTGEKVDLQIGADEKLVAFTVRFHVPKERAVLLRGNPILTLPRFSANVMETRYVESSAQLEFTCLFFRAGGYDRPIEITSYGRDAGAEKATDVAGFTYEAFSALSGGAAEPVKKVKGGFKKKFSEQAGVNGGPAQPETVGAFSNDAPAPYSPTVVVSGSATLSNDRPAVAELEAKVKILEAALKTREEIAAKPGKDDPLAKRDVLTNIKDGQSEGLKQNIKLLEEELAECKEREKELMKMVDKAVQMKEDAAKRIKDLDVKLKAASTGGGSKVQMLEKALEEQKRQNKELSKRVSELNEKLKAA